MKVLAIETSTLMGSVAVVEERAILCELTLHVAETHSSQLMPAIDYVLKTAGCSPDGIDAFAAALGPGSFTGLRIGLSTMKGLAVAASKPLVGIPTLEAMAWAFPYCPYVICPMLDARMKEIYAARFRAGSGNISRLSEDLVLPVPALLKDADKETLFFGSGAERYREQISEIMGDLAHFPSFEISGARASTVGFLALEKLEAGEIADIDAIEPLYIRESQAIEKLRRDGSGKRQ
jgi:tRNA threonylcarbamoyladenosine biosynthesis protein TsaB